MVWAGPGAEAAQPRLAEYGAAKVYAADSADFAGYVSAPTAELLAQLVAEKSPAAVLVAGTNDGKEIAGRLAVKTGSGILTDVVDLTAGDDGPVADARQLRRRGHRARHRAQGHARSSRCGPARSPPSRPLGPLRSRRWRSAPRTRPRRRR